MTAVDQFVTVLAEQRPEAKIKRDQYGRYRIPHPDTGKEMSWTRATTLANTLADRFGLEQWSKRNVVLGLGARHDLYAQAASCKPDDKDQLNRIVGDAEQAAKSSAGANLGTALHRFTERLDAGEDVQVPPPWDADIAAYQHTMHTHGISVIPSWIEQVVLLADYGVAGTLDRLLYAPDWPGHRIGDVKTGKDVIRYGMTEIALQLALYAHATHLFNPATGEVSAIHAVIDQDKAIVMHLPAGQGVCTIYEVDIKAGWNAVQLAVDVRNWRKRKDLAQQMVPSAVPEGDTGDGTPVAARADTPPSPSGVSAGQPIHPDAHAWLRQRVQAIKDAGHAATLAAAWSQHPEIPTFPKGGPRTVEEFNLVDDMCDAVEAAHGMGFGPSDPTQPTVTKATTKRS